MNYTEVEDLVIENEAELDYCHCHECGRVELENEMHEIENFYCEGEKILVCGMCFISIVHNPDAKPGDWTSTEHGWKYTGVINLQTV